MEAVPVTPFVEGLIALVSKEVNVYRILFSVVVFALLIGSYILVTINKFSIEEEEDEYDEELVSDEPVPQLKSESLPVPSSSALKEMARVDSKMNLPSNLTPRAVEECLIVLKDKGPEFLSNEEVLLLIDNGKIAAYALEKVLKDCERAVVIRRVLICKIIFTYLLFIDFFIAKSIDFDITSSMLPFKNYDYSKVLGVSCENVIGYLPLPVGVAGIHFFISL